MRNGGYGGSLARDVEDPELWGERFHGPTWRDNLRQRSRAADRERELHQRARNFPCGEASVLIRRLLERPLGSVRWKDAPPDCKAESDASPHDHGP